MNLQQKFGLVIKELRHQKQLSQEALAFRADIDRTYIGDIEKGERNVSLSIVGKLATAFEISISELFEKVERDV